MQYKASCVGFDTGEGRSQIVLRNVRMRAKANLERVEGPLRRGYPHMLGTMSVGFAHEGVDQVMERGRSGETSSKREWSNIIIL